ncbi:allophanate hydrolase [Lacticaseibacillus sp. GG6-2]
MQLPEKLTYAWLRKQYLADPTCVKPIITALQEKAAEEDRDNVWIRRLTTQELGVYLDNLQKLNVEDYPLWGIPFAIKDNIDLAGIPTTAGCPDYSYLPRHSATVVQLLTDAGAIPLGKTNLDQFATGLVGTRSPYGAVHNSYDKEMISGGSSSGSAVAVASGSVAFALGTDTAGSGRVPAALNGLFGFKPPRGAISNAGIVPACASLDCVAIFAKELKLIQQVYETVAGFDLQDPWSRVRPQKPGKLTNVFIPKEEPTFFGRYVSDFAAGWQHAKQTLQGSKYPLKTLPYGPLARSAALLYEGPWVAERYASLAGFIQDHQNALLPEIASILMSARAPEQTAIAVFQGLHYLRSVRQQLFSTLTDGVLVTPTAAGVWSINDVQADPIGKNADMGRYTNFCNLLDLAALAVPVAQKGFPFGGTVFSRPDQTKLLFETAKVFAE